MAYRLAALPTQLHLLIHARLASTASTSSTAGSTSNPYPYPTNPRPTPHQIFHLPHNASQQDIKARYYDLVRIHHPDSTHCRSISAADRHAHFQAISSAYDILRRKHFSSGNSADDAYLYEEIARRKRAFHRSHNRHAEYTNMRRRDWNAGADDRWKDQLIILAGVLTLLAGLAPGFFLSPFQMDKRHLEAWQNLSQAQSEAREWGVERRAELKKRAQEIKAANAAARKVLEVDLAKKESEVRDDS